MRLLFFCFFFFQAEDGIRDLTVTGVQTCALPIFGRAFPIGGVPGVRVEAGHILTATSPTITVHGLFSRPRRMRPSRPPEVAPSARPRPDIDYAPAATHHQPQLFTVIYIRPHTRTRKVSLGRHPL